MDIYSLFEARRNPDVNNGMRGKQVADNFAPFFGREDAFVSMVELPKIGIHPKTGHNGTPSGIYAYQLAEPEIINQFTSKSLPYMADAKFAALIVAKPEIKWFSSSDTEADFAPASEKLDAMMAKTLGGGAWWTTAKRRAWREQKYKADHPASNFYNDIWLGASILTMRHEITHEASDHDLAVDHFQHSFDASDYVNAMFDERSSRPVMWNWLFRKLGYDAMIDHGTKMIYNLEPFQTCFFHKGAIAKGEIFRNGRSEVHKHGKVIESAAHFIRIVKSGKMSVRQSLAFISAMMEKRDPGMIDDEPSFYVYNPRIRLSQTQICDLIEFMYKKEPEELEHALGSHQIFDTDLWKMAGYIIDAPYY